MLLEVIKANPQAPAVANTYEYALKHWRGPDLEGSWNAERLLKNAKKVETTRNLVLQSLRDQEDREKDCDAITGLMDISAEIVKLRQKMNSSAGSPPIVNPTPAKKK